MHPTSLSSKLFCMDSGALTDNQLEDSQNSAAILLEECAQLRREAEQITLRNQEICAESQEICAESQETRFIAYLLNQELREYIYERHQALRKTIQDKARGTCD
ncbi:MAG TPA: hypothetical protein VGB77_01480 [Abditibacteriaceae bacterium]